MRGRKQKIMINEMKKKREWVEKDTDGGGEVERGENKKIMINKM